MTPFDARWTVQQLEEARQRWLLGESASAIGNLVGKSRSAVVGKMKRLGLLRRDLPKVENAPAPVAFPKKVRVPQPPQVLPPVEKPATSSLHPVTIDNLKKFHCRAILGDVGKDGFALYCADPKAEGSSYCAFHHGLYTQPLKERQSHGQAGQL